MKRTVVCLLLLSLLLSGCGTLISDSYHSVKPHQEPQYDPQNPGVAVSSYSAMHRALENIVENGVVSSVINVAHYDQLAVTRDMRRAVQQVMSENPIGAYAVEGIRFELGTNGGEPAVAVTVEYVHGRGEIKKIQRVEDLSAAHTAIAAALDSCSTGIVLYIQHYEEADLANWAQGYAGQNLHKVIEQPQASQEVFPETGDARVVELKFSYQNSRDALLAMQSQLQGVWAEAVASGTGTDLEKLQGIYDYLTESFPKYQQAVSITPAYSLLLHGIGDAKAFAAIFAELCREAGVECIPVTGTRDGQPWHWNAVKMGEQYLHADILQCLENGGFVLKNEEEMKARYVWHLT